MKYRHEWKHEINRSDMLVLRQRLGTVMKKDVHSVDGKYEIRSLYFDTPSDKALREKLDGVNMRDKFRIRLYNGDTSFISLEKKSKVNGLCSKLAAVISEETARAIVSGNPLPPEAAEVPLCLELLHRMRTEGLRPKTIVDYTREAYVFAPGNVRVTLDYNIRTGLFKTDFLNSGTVTLPAGDAPMILEVKWDDFLPDIIRDTVSLSGRRASAFSKYAQCRIYG